MDRRGLSTVAISIVANGFLVPKVLELLDWSPWWMVLSSAATIWGIWVWGHQPPRRTVVLGLFSGVIGLFVIWLLQKPAVVEEKPQIEAAKPDPFNLCLMLIAAVQDVDEKTGLIKNLRIDAETVNRNTEPVEVILLDRSAYIQEFPTEREFITAEHNTLYPEQRNAVFTSQNISLGKGVRPGTVLHGRASFVARFGPTPDRMTTLSMKYSLVIQLLPKGNANVRRTLEPGATGECPYQQQYLTPDYGYVGTNDPTALPPLF